MTSKGKGVSIMAVSHIVSLPIVAEVTIVGHSGYIVNWGGLPEEANTTEYGVNVKRQRNSEFVLEHFKAAKIEGAFPFYCLSFCCCVRTQVNYAFSILHIP
jgi:hypothetical protein